jgi:hypothetical protein
MNFNVKKGCFWREKNRMRTDKKSKIYLLKA